MYSEVFCKVYNEFGWNFYPEIFGEQLLTWIREKGIRVESSMDLACGTGVLCEILRENGIESAGMDFSQGMIEIARQRNPQIHYDVADMITYRPQKKFDLVTCTGDALNHIMDLENVEKIFRNVYDYLAEGGYFVFDLLNENEISSSEPFEMDFTGNTRVWFQMTRPEKDCVNLMVRVYENGSLAFEENIRERVHSPETICRMLTRTGFTVERCSNRLLDSANPGTTWFIVAGK